MTNFMFWNFSCYGSFPTHRKVDRIILFSTKYGMFYEQACQAQLDQPIYNDNMCLGQRSTDLAFLKINLNISLFNGKLAIEGRGVVSEC